MLAKTNCFNCIYLSKRPGIRNYFIYKCSYWGLTTQKILPQSVIINSIGKRCPFFKQKKFGKVNRKLNNKNNNGLDIII